MNNYESYVFGRIPFPKNVVEDKERNARYYARSILARLAEMFEYTGLPDTIPKRYMLLQLFTNGNIFVTDKTNGNGLMTFTGGWGGEPDGYYVPTIYTVANPYVRIDEQFKIGDDGIMILNDSQGLGLLPVVMRYCELLAENDISLRIASINSRRRTIASVPDDNTKEAFDQYLRDIENGKLGSAIPSDAFVGELRASSDGSQTSSNDITALIELQQYIRATMYHALGLNANYNMKRESISANESQLNKDALFPLVENMLNEQRAGWDAVNEKYGTDIRVELSSAWKDNVEEKELDLDILENEADAGDTGDDPASDDPEETDERGEEDEQDTTE